MSTVTSLPAGPVSTAKPSAQEVWTAFEAAALFKKWQQANPVESTQIEQFWLHGGTVPVARTAFGKALVLEAVRAS